MMNNEKENYTSGLVSAVIVNYNGGDDILKCIDSIKEQTYSKYEIIIIDNNSKDDSLKNIREKHGDVILFEMKYNSGWGVACNKGIEIGKGEYISLLNNDAYLDKDCFNEMLKAINLDSKYGSCASKILLWDRPDTLEVVGLNIYRDGSSVGRGRLKPADNYNEIEEVFCANDCVCLYKREMIAEIGLYDPDFFIYADETDMGWRHQIAGWKCIYNPKALAYHAHSRAAGDYTDFKAYHVERNRLYITIKYFPLWELFTSFYFSIYRYLYQILLIKKGKGSLAKYNENSNLFNGLKVLIKAHFDALKKTPRMVKRRLLYKKTIRKISNKQFRELFKKYGITTKKLALYE